MDFDAVQQKEGYLEKNYQCQLRAYEGKVERIFTQRFAAGFAEGPCFTVDVDVGQGVSGGPVIDERGHVCGIVWAGAKMFFGSPKTLVSPLYPALLKDLTLSATLVPSVATAQTTMPMLEWIGHDAILSDGTESEVAFVQVEGKGVMACPRFHKDDTEHVHDDFKGFEAATGATPLKGEYWRARKRERNKGE